MSHQNLTPLSDLNLSSEDVQLVQQAWKHAIGINIEGNQPGLVSFQQIFIQMDEIRRVFGFTGLEDPMFIRHTKTFSKYLDRMIEALGNREEFNQLCDKLGKIAC